MALTYGITGLVTSWGTPGASFNSLLVGTNQAPSKFSMNVTGDALDTTRFRNASPQAAYKRVTKGLRSITGSFTSFINTTPRIGACGIVTNLLNLAASGTVYDAFLNEWTMSIKAGSTDTTRFNSTTCPEWREFTPGIVEWSGTAKGFLDNATVLPAPAHDNQPLETAANFAKFQISSTKILSGSLVITSVSTDVDPRNIVPVTFNYMGNDNLKTEGSASELWGVGDYTVTTPVSETLTLQTTTGQTYAGSAFWTSIDITCRVDALLEMTVNFQGTGAWTGFSGN